jgi:RTX calcium-binding nonapeptide repeat (4 copies)
MTRRLITALALMMVGATATAYAAVTPIPPAEYPPGCTPDGLALQGDAADDAIKGTSSHDLLRGGEGDDSLAGHRRADCLFGQPGEDVIFGGRNGDQIKGGLDDDLLAGGSGDDVIKGGRGADTIKGRNTNDFIDGGPDSDHLAGNNGNDRIHDIHGRNRIFCGRGVDSVIASAGSRIAKNCEKVRTRPVVPRHSYVSTVEIHGDPALHGKVDSALPACTRHRTVQVRRRSTGRPIGHTTTNRRGKWKLLQSGLHGRFYARVLSKQVLKHPPRLCLSDSSDHSVRVG